MNSKSIVAIGFLLCLPLSGFAGEIFPYQSTWVYKQVSSGNELIDTFYAEEFDTSSWESGPGAFGSNGSQCDIQEYVQTTWEVNSHLLLKHDFGLTLKKPVTIYWTVDNYITIYVNGELAYPRYYHGGCGYLDYYNLDIPAALLRAGQNELAVHVQDVGSESFFDMRMDSDDNEFLVCDAGGPYRGDAGVPVQFDGSTSYDNGGSIVAYSWDFGDGTTSAEMSPVHSFAQDGEYFVTLCVEDNDGHVSCCNTTPEETVRAQNFRWGELKARYR